MRLVAITVLVVLSCLATVNSQAQPADFSVHPSVNKKVEAFTNILVASLFPDLIDPKVSFARDQNNNVINEMNRGHLTGRFSADLPTVVSTPMEFDFSMDMKIVEIREKSFYQIDLKTLGSVSSQASFFNYVFSKMDERCYKSENISPGCKLLGEVNWRTEEKIETQFWLWKQIILADVTGITDPRFAPVKDDFLTYLDNNITIEQNSEGQTVFWIQLGDLAETFRDKPSVGNLLNEYSLIDYSIPSVKVTADQFQVTLDVHLIKYHRVEAFNDLMETAAAAQEPFEDPEVALEVATSLRTGTGSLASRVLGGFDWTDRQFIKAEYLKTKIIGSKNKTPEITDEELDLGLD